MRWIIFLVILGITACTGNDVAVQTTLSDVTIVPTSTVFPSYVGVVDTPIFACPQSDCAVVSHLPKGATAQVIDRTWIDDVTYWVKITYEGQMGYLGVFYTYAWTATEAQTCPRDDCPLAFTLPASGDNAILLLDTQPRDAMTIWWHVAYKGREGYLIPHWPEPSSGYYLAATQKALATASVTPAP